MWDTCLQEAPLEISWRSDRDWQEWHDASPASTSYSSSLTILTIFSAKQLEEKVNLKKL